MNKLHNYGKELLSNRDKRITGGATPELNFWVSVDSKDKMEPSWHTNEVCYGSLSRSMNSNYDTIIAGINTAAYETIARHGWSVYENYRISKDDMVIFIDWLVYASPWKHIFYHNQKAEEIVEQGYLFVDTNNPANHVLAGLTVMRQPWEYSDIIKTWLFLRNNLNNGFDPKVSAFAFYVSHLIIYRDKYFVKKIRSSSHLPLEPSSMSMESVKNLVNAEFQKSTRSLFNGGSTYGVTAMWNRDVGHAFYKTFVNDFNKEDAVFDNYKPLFAKHHDFYKDPSSSESDDNKEHFKVDSVLARLNKIFEEKIQ